MNLLEVSERVERLLLLVYELQQIIDATTDAPFPVIDAMKKVKDSVKELDEAIPEM